MTVTIATLGERALRRLGVTIVAAADRPALTVIIPPTALATGALVELGVVVVSGTSPGAAIVPAATLAANALVELGVIVVPGTPPGATVVPANQLATNALVELGVVAADETPAAIDQAFALTRVASVHDALAGQSFTSWTVDTVPQAVSEEYIKLTANIMASSFGKPGDPAIHAALEERVRKFSVVMEAPARAVAAVSAVHDALAGQSFVSWTINTVPAGVAEEYIKLTANIMASSFGKPGDPAIHAALEARVRHFSMVMQAPARAAAAVSAVHDALVAQAVVPWTLDTVPQAVSEEYIKLTANIMASSFGKPGDPAIHAALEARVRKVAVVLGALDIAVGAIMTVHHQLTARGLARWTIFDVPVAAEDPYVVLAANQLAPQFGQQSNPRDDLQGMRTLAQLIALPTSGEQITGTYF